MKRDNVKALKNWWWSVDNIMVALILMLAVVGAILTTTASPAVAERLKIGSFYFVYRQLIFLTIALAIIWIVSGLSESSLKKFALIVFVVCLSLMVIVLLSGQEVKGARRWINLSGFSLQPSELLKPFYFLITGLIISEKFNRKNFPGFAIAVALHCVVLVLLVLQPDFGMIITYSVVLAGQFFLAGISMWWVFISGLLGIVGVFLAYTFLPHVTKRIDHFINPEASENYQVEKSLESYVSGGIFGRGPGEGITKAHLPDSHTDFIFAVAGEEFGAIFSSLIILLFSLIVIRGIRLIYAEQSLFKIYTAGAIIMLFALQTIFNVGVTLNVFPTKGMTLPFISYGGSSTFSFAFAFGILLNLTKKERKLFLPKEKVHHHFHNS
jgi:cell division protein FtsW